jgi:hypothetical protein
MSAPIWRPARGTVARGAQLVVGFLLVWAALAKLRPRAGAFVAAAILVVFTTAVALALVRGLSVECGCFGTAAAMQTGGVKLIENLAILALAVAGTMGRES